MKKVFFILMCTLLIMGLFVTCGNSSPIIEEDVLSSIRFDNSASATKALSVDVTGLPDVEGLYWFYTAVKTDGGPSSGATGSSHDINDKVAVAGGGSVSTGKGIAGRVVSGFSVGEWTFRLYGYDNPEGVIDSGATPAKKQVYASPYPGTDVGAPAEIKAGMVSTIAVAVVPVSDSTTGTLKIGEVTATIGSPTFYYKVDSDTSWTALAGSAIASSGVTKDKGSHSVTIGAFYNVTEPLGEPEAQETIYAWVYGDLTTIVSGVIGIELPVTYQQVEYLQSFGTQWINTGLNCGSTDTIEIKGKVSNQGDYSKRSMVFSSRMQNFSHYCEFYENYFGIAPAGNWYQGVKLPNSPLSTGTPYEVSLKVTGTTKTTVSINVDGTEYSGSTTYYQGDDSSDYALGGINSTYTGVAKYYSAEVWLNGTLKRNFVPCYRKSDNKPGMYDLVTNTFFVNQGTGDDFTVGPDVN